MSKNQEIKIILHAPHNLEDITYLQNIHNELVTAIIRMKLIESGATVKEKQEYLARIIKSLD